MTSSVHGSRTRKRSRANQHATPNLASRRSSRLVPFACCGSDRGGRDGRIRILSRKRDGNVARVESARPKPCCRRPPRTRVLGEIDRLSADFQRLRLHRVSSLAGKRAACRKSLPELFEVLERSDWWCRQTAGAFDPRVETLTRLWSRLARQDRRPTDDELRPRQGFDEPAGLEARPRRPTRPSDRPTARLA